MTQHNTPTPTQRRIAELAAAMAEANPDAAEELAKHLAAEAAVRKRPRGFGFRIGINEVTGQVEMIVSKPNGNG